VTLKVQNQNMKDLLKSPLTGQNLIQLNISHNHILNKNQLLKLKLMKPTCPISPNTLMDSGTNSDSDHQLECLLMKRDLITTVLLVLPNMILIVTTLTWETELYPYSSKLGIILINQHTLLVLMISEDKIPTSVKIFHSNILMSMVIGSMSIMDSLLLKTKSTLLSSVKTLSKPLPFLTFLIMLHLLNSPLT
jgi:hypothetical protein